jgi:hypothetical protein
MKRNRIVIPFSQSHAGAVPPGTAGKTRKRKGVGRLLIIIAVILIIIVGGVAVGGYLWWRNYQTSPAYSLAILADAAQRNDTATIDSILDTDKVTEDFVGQARQRATGPVTSALSAVLPSQTDSALTTLTPKLKQTLHEELLKELQRISAPAAGKPFILVALGITHFADIKEESNIAHAAVNIKDEHLQLTMQPSTTPGRWRITAVQDDKLTSVITESMRRTVTSSGAQIQDELHKQADKFKQR